MTQVSGPLAVVTERSADVVEVWIRAPEPRPHNDGLIIDTTDRIEVTDGQLSFTCAPGPAILIVVSLVATGRLPSSQVPETHAIPILVPAAESVTLADVVNAATVSTLGQSLVEELAVRVANDLAAAQAAQAAASDSATAADQSATAAAGHAKQAAEDRHQTNLDAQATEAGRSGAQSAAEAAGTSAAEAAASASEASSAAAAAAEARTGAEAARTGAESAAGTAADGVRTEVSEHATAAVAAAENAATSAGTASTEADRSKSEADRAEAAAMSASTGVEVDSVGKSHLTPDLRGEIDGKAETGHTHTREQITDLPVVSPTAQSNSIAQRDTSGRLNINPATFDYQAATKGQVDSWLSGKSDVGHTHSEYATHTGVNSLSARVDGRPAFFSGPGAPPTSIPHARVGDWWLNESTMELHKITAL